MSLGISKDEAIYILSLIQQDITKYSNQEIRKAYGNVDVDNLINQLIVIIECT